MLPPMSNLFDDFLAIRAAYFHRSPIINTSKSVHSVAAKRPFLFKRECAYRGELRGANKTVRLIEAKRSF